VSRQVGFALPGGLRLAVPEALALLAGAAEAGVRPLFATEVNGLDAFALTAALASRHAGLELGTGVVPLGSRTEPALAMAATTIAGLSGATFHLGVGVSTPAVVGGWHGADHEATLDRTAARLGTLREVLRGTRRGSFGLAVDPAPGRVTVLLGAMGPRMVALGYEAADGVLVNHTPPRAIEPPPPDRSLLAYVWLRAAPDADARVRRELVSYACAPPYARHFTRLGFGDDVEKVSRARRDRRLREAPDQLSDRFVDELYVGPPGLDARLQAVRERGARPVVLPVTGDDPAADIRLALDVLGHRR
jgi:alkanesulfonate monooxygenase SsuD/methylene tetrahydromethanopterin reductase-like flavin-dependent oxidoreductase (luciferase family)